MANKRTRENIPDYITYREKDIEDKLDIMGAHPLDILVVGSTGAGKSSSVNSIFGKNVVKVGYGTDPQTKNIECKELNGLLRFWDSPGLGDSPKNDDKYKKYLIDLLYDDYSMNDKEYGLIDLVLVVLDGSGRDMGTTEDLLYEAIVPHFQTNRILVGINQADIAMKGRGWNEKLNYPEMELRRFLDDKVESVKKRIEKITQTSKSLPTPVYYSAEKKYNISKLLDMIIDNIPRHRRKLKA